MSHARANEYAGQEIGTIRYINRMQNLVVLTSGEEFRASDERMLTPLREGELVKVDFSFNGEHALINFIEPADAEDSPGASPSTDADPHDH